MGCLLAGRLAILALDLLVDDLAQLVGAFKAQFLGKLVIDLQRAGRGHFLDGDIKGDFLASNIPPKLKKLAFQKLDFQKKASI